MTTSSPRLGLAKPTTSDDFDTAEIAANLQLIDDHPGIFICTAATRPVWGGAHEGMLIFETDTALYWRWTGAAFVRAWPTGHLGGTTRTTSVTENSGAWLNILTVAVTVPEGGRKVQVSAGWSSVTADGVSHFALTRDATIIIEAGIWATDGLSGITYYDSPAAGSRTYTLAIMAVTGTFITVGATSAHKAHLDVVEV